MTPKQRSAGLHRAMKSCIGQCTDQAQDWLGDATDAQLEKGHYVSSDYQRPDGSRISISLHIHVYDLPKRHLMIEGPKGARS
jgi:hypothetical protein